MSSRAKSCRPQAGRSRNGLVAQPVSRACKRRSLATSRVSWPVIRVIRTLAPVYTRLFLNFRRIEIRHPEQMIKAFQDFQAGKIRLIVAFRHPYGDEPQLMFEAVDNLLPRLARKRKMPLVRPLHLRLIHDYAVPLWGDAIIRFILPRVGAVPIYHVKVDSESLKRIRGIMADDPCALGLAPEGQVSYHSETLPRIEQGAVRMGFWCAKDLDLAGRPEKVTILPISIHYRYDRRDLGKVVAATARLEALCGMPTTILPGDKTADTSLVALQARLEPIENRLYEIMAAYYTNFERKAAHVFPKNSDRWEHLLKIATETAEHLLGLPSRGDMTERMYRIRQVGWDRIYPPTPNENRSTLETALASRKAAEAWHAMRHMEFVDLMSYHDANYLQGEDNAAPSYDRIVESIVNLQDLAARVMGGTIANRPNNIRKHAVLIPAPGLDLTARLPEYRRNARQTVRDTTEDLGNQFKDGIKEYLHGKDE